MSVSSIFDSIINQLPKRQKDIVRQRFGLGGSKPKTLAALGDNYSITRERVRQIEAAALKTLHEEVRGNKEVLATYTKCLAHLKGMGGVRRVDLFADDCALVLKHDPLSASYVELLFAVFGKPLMHPANKDFSSFWYADGETLKEVKKFIDKVAKVLKNKKEAIIGRGEFDSIFYSVVKDHGVSDMVGLNFLLASKKFAANPFGDFGLTQWREIVPKTIRDKAYLVLRKQQGPMHFREIAKAIDGVRFDAKKAHPQTVHNELIKDKRFVLVGRGLYSLKEFGIEEGTTRELLSKLLKKHGPTDFDSLVQLVGEHRVLKRNTILLNLQSKKHFKKQDNGKYHLA